MIYLITSWLRECASSLALRFVFLKKYFRLLLPLCAVIYKAMFWIQKYDYKSQSLTMVSSLHID